MEREVCIRCGGTMENIGREKLQLGQYGVLMGHWDQHFAGALPVDIYCCRNCKKLEFYAVEAPEEGSIAQVPGPRCGQLHELDDPRCPHCGKRLLE